MSRLYGALTFQWLHVSVRTLFCSRASPFSQALRLQSKWFHRTRGAPCPWCTIYRDSRQCSEPSSVCNLRWTMSWVQGPIDLPPPHQNLEVRTRAFYGAHNALPLEFWPPCHHGDDAAVQVYEHFGEAERRFFRCPYYEVFIYFTCHYQFVYANLSWHVNILLILIECRLVIVGLLIGLMALWKFMCKNTYVTCTYWTSKRT